MDKNGFLSKKMTRKEFLKSFGLGVLSLKLFGNTLVAQAADDTVYDDNLQAGGGVYMGDKPPASTKRMWLNTGKNNNAYGVGGIKVPYGAICFCTAATTANGWRPITTTWTSA